MADFMIRSAEAILDEHGRDRTRLLDILWAFQDQHGWISEELEAQIAAALGTTALDIRETTSFYHFLRRRPAGRYTLYLANTVIGRMQGLDAVRDALVEAAGCGLGEVAPDGLVGLEETACVGLSDQEPALLVNKVVFPRLTPERVREIVARLRQGETPEQIANPDALPQDTAAYVDALVDSNVRQAGPVFFQEDFDPARVLGNVLHRLPEECILATTESRLRGRGGAGFSLGMKWRLCREAPGPEKYVICNADEGEPGTFKDRVLLTRSPQQVFAGMVAAAHAIGAAHGIVYLRAEYAYLRPHLEAQLQAMRDVGLLGKGIAGTDLDFDIRIQMGAGAYVCGDESALIESCEGKRGTPRLKPPFPVQEGYLGLPTAVCNVETFAAVARMLDMGSRAFERLGTPESSGTKLLSVSGDCRAPGIYEIEWGVSLEDVLALVGADDPVAVQVSGPSGECVSVAKARGRRFCYSDLSCNGSLMIFNSQRALLPIIRDFMQFFVDESCGICVPCRSGNVDLLHKMDLFIAGRAGPGDVEDLRRWGHWVQKTSRCGLGGTSPKPILTALANFPELFDVSEQHGDGPLLPSFDRAAALADYEPARDQLLAEARS